MSYRFDAVSHGGRAVSGLGALMAAVLLARLAVPALAAADAGEQAWLQQAATLVEAARASAPAIEFRARVDALREQLRPIVRAGRDHDRLRELHVQMVLLQTLLQMASDCHRGGRVLCPPTLMGQLDTQLAVARSRLPDAQG